MRAKTRVVTNREGFRDFDYQVSKPPATVRIVGIGDSLMFGWGVHQEKNYLALAENHLNTWYPQKRWEVINMALFDYNTSMEVAMLKEKGLKYSPDVVVLGFCANDYSIPWGVRQRRDYFSPGTSFLAQFVRHRLDPLSQGFTPTPERYRYLAGKAAFEGALAELSALGKKHGFEVIVLVLNSDITYEHEHAMKTARRMGFHVVNVAPSLKTYMKMSNVDKYKGSEMTTSDDHPSVVSHSIAAMDLLVYMKQSGMISRLLSK